MVSANVEPKNLSCLEFLECFDGSWMSPPAYLGKELTVTCSVKEGARDVEKEVGRQGVKDSVIKRGY